MNDQIQPAFAVGIPARNEEMSIAAAIESVLAAAEAIEGGNRLRLVVACDSCSDSTANIAHDYAALDDRVAVIDGAWCSAGAARATAIDDAIAHLRRSVALTDIWVATTDADTVVPADWLVLHAQAWSRGDHAIAGIVDLIEEHGDVRTMFDRHYTLGHDHHEHVHGANLGVRADAYLTVGGFPTIALAEDHALWNALRSAGFSCRSSVALRVMTSGRLAGRAAGGFADTLSRLVVERFIGEPDASATA